jgi:hypothetical protein
MIKIRQEHLVANVSMAIAILLGVSSLAIRTTAQSMPQPVSPQIAEPIPVPLPDSTNQPSPVPVQPDGTPPALPVQTTPPPQFTPPNPVPSVAELSDVLPTDWAAQALQQLVKRYGCISGFPDGRYLGNRAITRLEFAAGLSACLTRFEAIAGAATQEEVAALLRLQEEFAAELAVVQGRLEAVEARFAAAGVTPFSTTTKLRGGAVFAVSDLLSGGEDETESNLVFQSRVDLALDTSFGGEDRLQTVLSSGNFERFALPDGSAEGRFGFAANTEGLELDSLSYEFPMGDRTNVSVIAVGGNLSDFTRSINSIGSSTQGVVSRFAQRNPIYRAAGLDTGSGVGISIEPIDELTLSAGYVAATSSNPNAGNGLFNGGYAWVGQVAFTPEPFSVAIAYAHSYVSNEGNDTGTGSANAVLDIPYSDTNDNIRPVVVNSYGLDLNYQISDAIEIGGWLGFSNVRVIGLGDADVWNYAVRLALPDLGGEGNMAGLVVGMQPRLTGTSPGLGLTLGERRDPDVGLHVEGFYRIRLNDHVSVTPGVVWLTAPNHDQNNPDAVITTIRTSLTF